MYISPKSVGRGPWQADANGSCCAYDPVGDLVTRDRQHPTLWHPARSSDNHTSGEKCSYSSEDHPYSRPMVDAEAESTPQAEISDEATAGQPFHIELREHFRDMPSSQNCLSLRCQLPRCLAPFEITLPFAASAQASIHSRLASSAAPASSLASGD